MLTMVGMSVVAFSPGQPYGCWKNWNFHVADAYAPEIGALEVEELVPGRGALALEEGRLVVAVQVVLVGPITQRDALQELAGVGEHPRSGVCGPPRRRRRGSGPDAARRSRSTGERPLIDRRPPIEGRGIPPSPRVVAGMPAT
jgi:hypothetical protein